MLEFFTCPDEQTTKVKDCISKCRMDARCLTMPTLTLLAEEREWNGIPSTTQLINGTQMEFLKLTMPYTIDPDKRAFMLAGTKHHVLLKEAASILNLPAEIPLSIDRDVFDLLEPEDGSWALTDYKNWGSYRVAKALGLIEIGRQPDPSGAIYKVNGKYGEAGEPKTIPMFRRIPDMADLFGEELQLNRYRIMLEELGLKVSKMQLQVTVRDGGLAVAISRGITRNLYLIPIKELNDTSIISYFDAKGAKLLQALADGECLDYCDDRECWEGRRCKGYCEVSIYCPKGILTQED